MASELAALRARLEIPLLCLRQVSTDRADTKQLGQKQYLQTRKFGVERHQRLCLEGTAGVERSGKSGAKAGLNVQYLSLWQGWALFKNDLVTLNFRLLNKASRMRGGPTRTKLRGC